MNRDYIDNSDSFSTLVEKERQDLIRDNEREKEERKCIITNVAIPGGLIVIFIIIFLCFNRVNVDGCGCNFEADVASNEISGRTYVTCVEFNYECYNKIDLT